MGGGGDDGQGANGITALGPRWRCDGGDWCEVGGGSCLA